MPAKSNIRITHDPEGATPTVILDYGDKIRDHITLDGEQEVKTIKGLRVVAIETAARGNAVRTLEIGLMVNVNSSSQASLEMFRHSIEIPMATADLRIDIDGHLASHFILRSCTVESFPAEISTQYITKTFNFNCGNLEEVANP